MTESLEGQIVAALCRDARADVPSIAEETDAVATTVQKRLRALEEDGSIAGYTAQVDYGRLGYETVVVQLSVDLDAVDDVTARLRERPEFVTVYQTSGPRPVFGIGKFEDSSAVATCLHELHADPDVRSVHADAVRSIVDEWDSPLVDD